MSRSNQQVTGSAASECVDPTNGWTLWEAFERTTDPALFGSWRAAKSEYEKARTPIPSARGSFLQKSPEIIRKHRKIALQSFTAAKNQFRQVLASTGLYSSGSRDGRTVLPTPIFRESWRTLLIRDLMRSVVQERSAAKTRIYNVRIFPLIHSPDAIVQLSGLSFVEAFRRCVLNDPEVIAASKRIGQLERYKSVFQEGQYPGELINFRWPLEISADALAFSFVSSCVYFVGDPLPKPSDSIRHVSEVIIDRWQGLRRRLADGELVAQGTFSRTGMVGSIDSLQWTRTNLSVHVQNGDLLGYEDNKSTVLWSGLRLRAAAEVGQSVTTFHEKPTIHDQARSITTMRRRPSPVADQIAEAIKLCGVEGLPGSKSWKEIATLIEPFMHKRPSSENEWQALIKAVERHFKRP